MITLFIIILVIVVFVCIFSLPTAKILINSTDFFKQVYSIESDLLNINVKVSDKSDNEIANISDFNDVSYLVQEIGNTKIKGCNGTLKGDYIKLEIINNKLKTVCKIAIKPKEIVANDNFKNLYEYDNNLYDKINKVVEKYIK